MNEELYSAMDRYLANEMNGDEKLAFEMLLRDNADATEKFSIYKSSTAILVAQAEREEKEKLFRQNLVEIASTELINRDNGRKLNWYAWAAASVGLACISFLYTSLSKPAFEKYAVYEPLALVERGGESGMRRAAQEAFNNKNYEAAVTDITLLLKDDADNAALKLYKGIALLELNRIKEGNILFTEVQKSASVYKYKGTWMLALSALKEKDYEKCEALLKQIPESAAEYSDAQKLLRDL